MNTNYSWSRCAKEFVSSIDDLDREFPSTGKLEDSQVRPKRRRNSKNALSSRKSIVATDVALANIEQIETTELVSRWIAREICTPPLSDQNPSSPSADIFSELKKSPAIECSPELIRPNIGSGRRKKRRNRSPHLTGSPIISSGKFGRKKRRRFDPSLEQRKADKSRSSPINSQVNSKPLILSENRRSLRKKQPRNECEKLQDPLDFDVGSQGYRYFELRDSTFVNNVDNCKRNNRTIFTDSKTVSATEISKKALRFGCIELSQDFLDEDHRTKSLLPFDEEEGTRLKSCKQQNVEQNFLFVDVNCLSLSSKNTEHVLSPVTFEAIVNEKGSLRGFKQVRDLREVFAPPAKEMPGQFDDTYLSQDLFDDEPEIQNSELKPYDANQLRRISTSIQQEARPLSPYREGINWLKTEDDNEEEILGHPEPILWPCGPEKIDRFSPEIKTEEDSRELEIADVQSFCSFIQDTEEVIPPSRGQDCGKLIRGTPNSSDLIKQEEKFSILDSEFRLEKKQFVTDTERIDYDTSSENGEGDPDVVVTKINISNESDSDKTVSDIIEEPLTQDYIEPSKPTGLASSSLLNSISAVSPKISETVSATEPLSFDISVGTTSPRVGESFAAIPELIFSSKKKKSRPKKGSLSARLQKLVSGQVSNVRLWRYQISHDLVFQESSTLCVTLSLLQSWVQDEKNLYLSRVLEDSHGLLNDCFDKTRGEENRGRNLIVMTNPEFARAVKMLPGTAFKIYSPWKIFNRDSKRGDLILHALYFQAVSIKVKEGSNSTESLATKNYLTSKVTHEYDCPCLENGRIDDSCSVKFASQKVNVMDVIFNEK